MTTEIRTMFIVLAPPRDCRTVVDCRPISSGPAAPAVIVRSCRAVRIDRPHDLHERLRSGRKGPTALRDEAIVEAEPGRYDRQRHAPSLFEFGFDLDPDCAADAQARKDDPLRRRKGFDQDTGMESILNL